MSDESNRALRDEIDRIVDGVARVEDVLTRIADAADAVKSRAESDGTISPPSMGYAYFQLRACYESLDKLTKRIYHAQDAFNKHLVPERMRAFNIDGFRIPEIARSFSIVEKTSATFVDKDAGLAWLREIGQGDMIQETVNAGTLSAFCRNLLLEEGIEPPEDKVRMNTYSTTSMVRYRPK